MILHLSIDVTGFTPGDVEDLRDNMLIQLDNTEAKLVSTSVIDRRNVSVDARVEESKRARAYISHETAALAVRQHKLMSLDEAAVRLGVSEKVVSSMITQGRLQYEIANTPGSSLKKLYVYISCI